MCSMKEGRPTGGPPFFMFAYGGSINAERREDEQILPGSEEGR